MSLTDVSSDGVFRVLAVDHRDSLRVFAAPDDPDSLSSDDLTRLKIDLVGAVAPFATGVMLEPEYSIPQVADAGVMPHGVGFFAALEAQGYLADPSAGTTTLCWSPTEAAASGAACAKLLLPYHPDHELAAAQRSVAHDTVAACHEAGLPIALEPLFHSLADPSDRERVVLQTVDDFAASGADLLKLPFPVDPGLVTDEAARSSACRGITERCRQPWALLSGGGDFDSFAGQVDAAMSSGCAGYMVGRALWGEAARCSVEDRAAVIADVVVPRWHHLVTLTS